MLFLDILRYVRPIDEVDALLEPHRDWLKRGFASGHLLMAGRREPRIGGVIVIKAETVEEAQALAAADPFITGGVAEFELIAWEPTMRSADAPEAWAPKAAVIR